MRELEKTYSEEYYAMRTNVSFRIPIIAPVLITMFRPKIVLDVSCGNGDFVNFYLKCGLEAFGTESNMNAFKAMRFDGDRFGMLDLRQAIHDRAPVMPDGADLVTCFEVMSHVEPEYAPTMVANLKLLSSKWVVCNPRPDCTHPHWQQNCQPPDYWERLFTRDHTFRRVKTTEIKFKDALAPVRHKPQIKTIVDNILVFERMI